jgi:pyruvate dehydrogenase complex dehydrogenase (E1) component
MNLTPEQLDEARGREAYRLHCAEGKKPEFFWPTSNAFDMAMVTAARLAREGWTPSDRLNPTEPFTCPSS